MGYKGGDPFNKNFWKFRSKTEWIGSVQPEKFRKKRSTFRSGPLFSVGPFQSKWTIAHCRNVRALGRVSYIDYIENLNISTELLMNEKLSYEV